MLSANGLSDSSGLTVSLNGLNPNSATSRSTGPEVAKPSRNEPSSLVETTAVAVPERAVITAPGSGWPADVTRPVRSVADMSEAVNNAATNVRFNSNQLSPVA